MEETPKFKWSAIEAPTSNQTVIWDGNNDRVAVIDEFPKGAKSNLIKSAPDLYEALKEMVDAYYNGFNRSSEEALEHAKSTLNSAIKK